MELQMVSQEVVNKQAHLMNKL
ncbi:hypothetical protein LUU34_01559300 [Aix galericulata]|nr:hypothetical protein LUU34_01559300 [Aix galericulata]